MKPAHEKRVIDGPDGKMKTLLLRPREQSEPLPGILWIHGGGYILGMAEMVYMSRAHGIAKRFGAVVLSPAYRLAGKAPYPAALEDCYAALLYLKENAGELGVRSDQIFAGGESAGGGLTAALCMLARDRGEVSIAYQMPLYPMLDCEDTESSRDNHGHVWNTRRNHYGWRRYLRGVCDGADVPAYASPARQKDYAGLPPAYTFVCEGEPFYCETLAYIAALRSAGVEAEVDIYPGNTHAFDMMRPRRPESKQAVAALERQYVRAVEKYHREQPDKGAQVK